MSSYLPITPALLRERGACYSDEKILEMLDGRESVTVNEVIGSDIPHDDRVWVALQVLSNRDNHLFARWCAERAVHLCGDNQRPRAASNTARRYADGEATDIEMREFCATSWDTDRTAAMDSARDATWFADRAAACDTARHDAFDAAEAAAEAEAWYASWSEARAEDSAADRAAARASTMTAARAASWAAQAERLRRHFAGEELLS